jgi:hypothetical protein
LAALAISNFWTFNAEQRQAATTTNIDSQHYYMT